MGISELLAQLADPATIKTLSFADKMWASLVVTFLGMGITFLALIILQIVISLLARFTAQPSRQPAPEPAPQTVPQTAPAAWPVDDTPVAATDDDELPAVISAVLAMYSARATGDIVIRNIRKIDPAPAWGKAGIVDQMNSRF
jgi:sodium pump decarboxylase gamma subunit